MRNLISLGLLLFCLGHVSLADEQTPIAVFFDQPTYLVGEPIHLLVDLRNFHIHEMSDGDALGDEIGNISITRMDRLEHNYQIETEFVGITLEGFHEFRVRFNVADDHILTTLGHHRLNSFSVISRERNAQGQELTTRRLFTDWHGSSQHYEQIVLQQDEHGEDFLQIGLPTPVAVVNFEILVNYEDGLVARTNNNA